MLPGSDRQQRAAPTVGRKSSRGINYYGERNLRIVCSKGPPDFDFAEEDSEDSRKKAFSSLRRPKREANGLGFKTGDYVVLHHSSAVNCSSSAVLLELGGVGTQSKYKRYGCGSYVAGVTARIEYQPWATEHCGLTDSVRRSSACASRTSWGQCCS